jgi:4-amino-4-deoxy-L-arabinose transferase-like glycosyltransferase
MLFLDALKTDASGRAPTPRWWLTGLLAVYALIGLGFSLATPIFEASDERWHYPVIRHLADTGQLPVQDPTRQTDWHQEGSQPPLYYLLGAALTVGIDTSDYRDVHQPNPHAVVGEPLVIGNKNMMIHTQREDWPWRGTTLAVRLVRLLSIALGGLTVWLTYRLARLVYPADARVALLAAALTAFNPMFVFISASVNNDNLAAPLAASTMVMLLTSLQRGPTVRDGVALGILLGMGALTKLSVLALAPLVGLALTWQAKRRSLRHQPHAWRTWLTTTAIIGGLMAILAGWWYWRNYSLYADPTGLSRMLDIAGRRHEAFTLERLWYEFEGFRISYWALFGALNILVDRWIYTALDALTAIAAAGILVGCLRSLLRRRRVTGVEDTAAGERSDPGSRMTAISLPSLLLVLGWVILVLISLIRWTSQTYASQGRLMFVAIAGISTLLAVGWLTWFPPRWRWPAVGVVGGGLCLLSAICPLVYIAPAYSRPPLLVESQLPPDVVPVNWDIAGAMRLVGYRIEPTNVPGDLPAVRPFEALPITLYWQARAPITENYSVFIHLLGRNRAVVGQVNTYPGLGLWPTTQLRPGDIVADTYRVPIAADAVAPTLLRVHAGLYRYNDPGRPALTTINPDGKAVEPWLTTVKLIPWVWPVVAPAHPLAVRLGDTIRLLGYDLVTSAAGTTGPDTLTLYWQADARPPGDYTVFIQLWTGDTRLAGFDGPPVHGDYPTDWWEAGEVILDEHHLDLSSLPVGHPYRLLLGLYRLDTGERVPAYGQAGPLPDYAVEIEGEKH